MERFLRPLLAATATIVFGVAFAQTPTDACSYLIGSQYTVNSSCTYQDFDKLSTHVANLVPTTCSGDNNGDSFGWFSATGTITNVSFDPDNNHDALLHIYTGACGSLTEVTCANTGGNGVTESVSFTTTIGTNYLVRIQRNGTNNAMDGRLCVWSTPPPPANDNPCGAVALAVGSSCTNTASTNVGATATASIPAPGCAAYTTADVWFSFVAPASGRVTLGATANTLTDAGMALYSATACNGTFTLIECDDNDGTGNMPAIQRTGLTPGTTYYVRVWGNSGATGTFSICAWDNAPANDNPCAATALTVNTSCSASAATNVGSYATAGVPAPTCGTYTYSDVWFTMVAPASGHMNISTSAGTLTDAAMAVYSATACNGTFTQISCNDNANGANMPAIDLTGLTPGATYYARVWGNGELSGTFSICAYDMPGDAPCTATALTVNASCTNVSSTNVGASQSGNGTPSCGTFNSSSDDVWFTVVAPVTGIVYLNTTAGTMTDGAMAVYSGASCNAALTEVACNNNGAGMPSLTMTGLTSGQTYYVRFWGNAGTSGSFSICAYDPSPANDNPCGATALTLGTSCSSSTYANTGATVTPSIPTPGCATVSGGDVWFSFVAPASGFASFRTTAGTLTNTAMALYSAATCSTGMVLEDCDDNNGVGSASFLAFSDLVAGNTYYLRVWGVGGTFGSFDLCAYGPPTGSSCFYTLNLNDEIGDGWGGSTVGISVNGGAYTNYTLTNGEREVIYFGVTTGQLIMMQYTSSGAGQSEISYILQLGGGQLYSAGPTPATGLVYTGVVDCVAPAATASDCRGSSRLCGATAFNGSPSNTGLVSDLNSQNRGCLASSERQGLWYYFIPSASGTFEFTVTPTNASDDYDFAVWGPFTSFDCHQKRAPLRCSYSSTTGNTGLQVGAGDDTEGQFGNKWVNAINGNLGEVYILYVSNYSRSGLSFGLTWTLTNGADLDCLVLPIELGGFEAQPAGEEVDLTWWTASEQNNDHFIVERSADAENFHPIGTVSGAGNSTSTVNYAWRDADPLPGTSYYRLTQVDHDGQYSRSPIESVNFQHGVSDLRAFPNPAQDIVQFPVEALRPGACEVRILDAQGRMVLSHQASLSEGNGRLNVPIEDLPAGQYIAQVIGPVDQGILTGRFVIAR